MDEILLHTALIRDQATGTWLRFRNPVRMLAASSVGDVGGVFDEVEAALAAGLWVAGFVSYEAAPAFDASLETHLPGTRPIALFGVFPAPETEAPPRPSDDAATLPGAPATEVSEAAHASAIERIREAIRQGDTYQANFTYQLRSDWQGDAYALFRRLLHAQAATYGAFLDFGSWAVCSASPELFFRVDGDRIESRPMKGTLRRRNRRDPSRPGEDGALSGLTESEKDKAENLMIVDMVRNDLARVCEPGSVRVPALFAPEAYPTVWQLTSTVQGQTSASLTDLFGALFPAASITGAPKAATMRLIRDLEVEPRGIYTGAIGFASPGASARAAPGASANASPGASASVSPGASASDTPGVPSRPPPLRKAQFSVAIRTAIVDAPARQITFGVGGGIVWDSRAEAEYDESRAKAAILSYRPPGFELLETMRWDPGTGFTLLGRHLARMQDAADFFGYIWDEARLRETLARVAAGFESEPKRVRVTSDAPGRIRVLSTRLAPAAHSERPTLALARASVSSADPFLAYKTTHRAIYDDLLAASPEADDVILWNERGELCETCYGNLFVDSAENGVLLTPPLSSGLLAGTLRAELLASGAAREAVLRPEDLRSADRVRVGNSVRGLYPVGRLLITQDDG